MDLKKVIIDALAGVILIGLINTLRSRLKGKLKPWLLFVLLFTFTLVLIFIYAYFRILYNF